ncbi:MAG: hypothetical protein WBH39_07170, partial [Candidatus Microthrix parvicella]
MVAPLPAPVLPAAMLPPAAEVTFCPADPPRRSLVACHLPQSDQQQDDLFTAAVTPPKLPGEPTLFTHVAPARPGVKPTALDIMANLVPFIDLVPQLLAATATATPSQRAMGEVVRTGLALVAAGRLLPCVTPTGWDAWAVAPLG